MRTIPTTALLIAAHCLLFSCSAEKKDAAYWQNQRDIIETAQKLELARYRLSRSPVTDAPLAPAGGPAELATLESAVTDLTLRKNELEHIVLDLKQNWDGFRREVLFEIRSEVAGKSYDTFQTESGKTYRDVVVSRIDDQGVAIKHAHGSARIRCADLTHKQQAFFGLDAELAAAALAVENRELAAYEQQLDLQLAAIEKTKRAEAAEKRAEESRVASNLASARANQITSASVSPLSASVGRLGASSRYSSGSYYSYRRPRYRNTYYYTGSYTNSYVRPATWSQCNQIPFRPAQITPCPSPTRPVQAFFPRANIYSNP